MAEQRPLHDDVWLTRDRRVLMVVVEYADSGKLGGAKGPWVAEATGLDVEDVVRAARNLARDGLVTIHETRSDARVQFTHITGDALRETGKWPSTEAALDRLLAALQQLADQAETPEEKTRWQKVSEHLAANGAQLGWSVVTAMLTGQLPGQ